MLGRKLEESLCMGRERRDGKRGRKDRLRLKER